MVLYTNLEAKKTVKNALLIHARDIANLNIASAFFSASDDILEIVKRGINVNLIVRLGEGTSIESLKALMNKSRINIRYYTDRRFHPKIYIFGDRRALIGSANATKSGITTNSEVSVAIEQDHEDFDELVRIFWMYWEDAIPLTMDTIKRTEHILNKYKSQENSAEREIESALGAKNAPPSKIISGQFKKSKQQAYVDDYERGYQEFKSAYDRVYEIYARVGKRKPESLNIPLRIEIDQFWNYIREEFTTGDSFNDEPVRADDADLTSFVTAKVEQWLATDFPYLKVVVENYKVINERFNSVDSINGLSIDEIFEALMICHAFRENKRWMGKNAKDQFFSDVSEQSLKDMISYLLHEKKVRFTRRLADCLFGQYKIRHMDRSCCQELLGWVNQEDIPIFNNRTFMALRYLGAIDWPVKTKF
jgi:hypothetical protein